MNTHPCRNKCTPDSPKYCRGCYRSHKQILNWNGYTPYQQEIGYGSLLKRIDKEIKTAEPERVKFLNKMKVDHVRKRETIIAKKLEKENILKEIDDIYHKKGVCQELLKMMFTLKGDKLYWKIDSYNGMAGGVAGTSRYGYIWISVKRKMFKEEVLVTCYKTGYLKPSGTYKKYENKELKTIDLSVLSANQNPGGYVGYYTNWYKAYG